MKNYSRANTGIDLNYPVFIESSAAAAWQSLFASGDVTPGGESGIKAF
jgi:hypothetical protein